MNYLLSAVDWGVDELPAISSLTLVLMNHLVSAVDGVLMNLLQSAEDGGIYELPAMSSRWRY